MRMPKNKDEFEQQILSAFSAGMNAGYGVEHTDIHEEEAAAIKEYAERRGFRRKEI